MILLKKPIYNAMYLNFFAFNPEVFAKSILKVYYGLSAFIFFWEKV